MGNQLALWMFSGFLVMLLVLSLTGNGTLANGIPVWGGLALAALACAGLAWATLHLASRRIPRVRVPVVQTIGRRMR